MRASRGKAAATVLGVALTFVLAGVMGWVPGDVVVVILLIAAIIYAGVQLRPGTKRVERDAEAKSLLATRAQLTKLVDLVSGRADGATPLIAAAPPMVDPSESLLLVVPAMLWRQQHAGYALESATLGLSAAKPGALAGLTLGASASTTTGIARRIEGYDCVDAGRLALTTERVIYIGQAHAAEVSLGRVLDVSAAHGLLDVAHEQRQHRERYAVQHADLIAALVDVSAQRYKLTRA